MTSPAPILLPDDEALVCNWLAARTELDGVTVAEGVPEGYRGEQQVVTVSRIGGGMDRAGGGQWLDRPRVDIDCYGPTKASAKALSQIVRSLLAVARWDDHTAAGAVWCDSSEDVGPQWLPSTDYPGTGRYLLQYSILIHPVI